MRLGIGSYTYGWAVGMEGDRPPAPLSAPGLIDRAVSLGVGIVQLCDNLPGSTFDADSVAGIREYARRHDVQIQVGTRGCRPEHLRAFARIAAELGSPVLRVVLDAPGDQPDSAEILRRLQAVRGDL